MDRSSFFDALQTELAASLPDGVSVSFQQVQKNNGVILDALCVRTGASVCSPVIYLDPLYEQYRSGRSAAVIARAVAERLDGCDSASDSDFDNIRNLEIVKSRIAYRLISVCKNESLLSEIPWIPFLDLAVVFYLRFEPQDGYAVSMCINHGLARSWGLTADDLFAVASENTPELLPAKTESLPELMAGFLHVDPDTLRAPGVPELHVLSNVTGIYGAACLLYDGVIGEFARKADADLLILPSSVHEVMLLADSPDSDHESLRDTVRSVNGEAVPPEDFLSDELYRYDRSTRSFTVVSPGSHDEAGKDVKTSP